MNDMHKLLPPMLTDTELEKALAILPEYDASIIQEDAASRLIAMSALYDIFVPTQMSKEIYSKMYLSLLRSLQKKGTRLSVQQGYENHKAIKKQEHRGLIGGADSFTIIGASGIGKSCAVSRTIELLSANCVIEVKEPYTKIIPCVVVQAPYDSSVKSLLFSILKTVDDALGSSYYDDANKVRTTTDMLIGAVSQVCQNHIGLLCIDEIQHIVEHKNGFYLLGALLQLINSSGVSVAMIGTPECTDFFSSAMQLARRSVGLRYEAMEYGEEFRKLCEVLYHYQYVRIPSVLDDATVRWLYERTNGNVSVLVGLIHDAQEIAILDGSEELNLKTLHAAYDKRMAMLHDFIKPMKKSQTSKIKKQQPLSLEVREISEDFTIAAVITQAKKEGRNIMDSLRSYVTVEEVRV